MKPESYVLNVDMLPSGQPTHILPAEFWEHLGRAVGAFGYLEEVLGKAIFAFTSTKTYPESEVEDAFKRWIKTMNRALSETLPPLSDMYLKAVEDLQGTPSTETTQLVEEIKEAAKVRNILCHASWRAENDAGEIIPLFVNRKQEYVDSSIDVDFLKQVHAHVAELCIVVIESVTILGYRFPGSNGPGLPIVPSLR